MPSEQPFRDLRSMPGHLARRVHQLAVALFSQEVSELNLTPVQYATLQTIANYPDVDQKTLAIAVGFDASTIGGVLERLEARGLISRTISPTDRRARIVDLTETGAAMLGHAHPLMQRSQVRLLEVLKPEEREEFMRMMEKLIDANAALSNIPAKD